MLKNIPDRAVRFLFRNNNFFLSIWIFFVARIAMKNEIKSNESLYLSQNVPENLKIKVARNDRGKVRPSL